MIHGKSIAFVTIFLFCFHLTSNARGDCSKLELAENKSNRIAIVVNNKLAHGIHDSLEVYLNDLRHEHYDPVLLEWQTDSNPDASKLRDALKALYHEEEGLQGAVLIGDLPVNKIYDEFQGKTFIEEEYFRNLVENPGEVVILDSYGNTYTYEYDVSEIWTSRIVASPLRKVFGAAEAEIVNEYLKKNHAYRTGKVVFPKQNLLYSLPKEMENDQAFPQGVSREQHALSSGSHQLREYAPSRVEEFLQPLKSDSYEIFLWARHGSSTMLSLGKEYSINNIFYLVSKYVSPQISGLTLWDRVSSNLNSNRFAKEDIAIATAFTFANSCSLGDFLTEGYFAGAYVFNQRTFVMGMLAAPKPIAFTDMAPIIELFQAGRNLGSAYRAGREAQLCDHHSIWRSTESRGVYILGDGTLKIYSGETNTGIDPITYLNSHNPRRSSQPIRGKNSGDSSALYRVDTD